MSDEPLFQSKYLQQRIPALTPAEILYRNYMSSNQSPLDRDSLNQLRNKYSFREVLEMLKSRGATDPSEGGGSCTRLE